MYGVPADLDLSPFVGATLLQIALGEFQIQFRFDRASKGDDPVGGQPGELAVISAEGGWTLVGPDGKVVDQQQEHAERSEYRVHQLLGQRVVRTSIAPPLSLTLHFEAGHELTIFDDSSAYESFSIQPGGIYI